jgi:hypothetical protein
LVNLVQWTSWVTAAVASSVIAADLGFGRLAQGLSALLVLTLPTAIVEASTTQNDLVAGALALTALALLPGKPALVRGELMGRSVLVGVAVGLAALTKVTALALVLPFFVLWAWRNRDRLLGVACYAGVTAVLAVMLNAPHLTRVYALYGDPFGGAQELTANASPSIVSTLENLVRNFAMNLATPWRGVNSEVTGVVVRAMDAVGLDAANPGSTFRFGPPFVVQYSTHEDISSNAALSVLLLFVVAGVAISRRLRGQVGGYAIALITSAVIFSALFAWQIWGNRLLLPWFLLGSVLVGVVLSQLPRVLVLLASTVTIVAAVPFMLSSPLRPLVGPESVLATDRASEYFRARPDLEGPYAWATGVAAKMRARDVVLVQGIDSWEYPLWVLLRQRGSQARLREHTVTNQSRALVISETPDFMICTTPCPVPEGWVAQGVGSVGVAYPPPDDKPH